MTTSLGELIKFNRTAKGLTQSNLAEGICTQATISNLESKSSLPTISILLQISDKLNIEFDDIYEYTLENTNDYNRIFRQVRELCGKRKHEEAYNLIEKEIKFDMLETIYDIKQYYYYMGITSLVGFNRISDGIYYFNQALAAESQNSIDFLDVLSLNGIGIAYFRDNENDEASTYFEQSIEQLDELSSLIDTMKDSLEISKIYYNTALFYSKIGKHNKAVNLCSLGIQLLKNENLTYYLEYLLYEKAFNLMKLNKLKESEKYYLYALVIADLNDNQQAIEGIKKDMKEYDIQEYKYR
ncbi:helix-turn-helix transcriptional regulator [Carnobacterium maltaromaticum]|jgi:transcriptional regulator with XRE-family HTH domain|uniref:helix-turn-helix transcriptional regulator n=1 Tax=Carnobacterium maltaromaticum TaxID=2751 RepID=UPI000E74C1D9|nr:helix-turn-helix transcriptional regulator [Carnobacterium maltaromaticum]AOA01524.1 transcriptional regulator [Carnobacterium maltaromaticum]MCI1818970.1 helix-turn-helix transcriptional regulator [Carnobacterium maltaromaticum]